MSKQISLILFLTAVTFCDLVYVTSLFRHGARYTVLQLYDHIQTSIDDGELTGVGMRQHYNLGRYLREQYINSLNFLNSSFDHKQISIFSTQKNRTIQSALSHLTGMFPESFGPKIQTNIPASLLLPSFQNTSSFLDSQYALPSGASAFPVHNADPIFNCHQQTILILETLKQKTPYISLLDLEYTPLFLRMVKLFKLKSSIQANIGVMALLYDNVVSDYYLGKPLPEGFDWQDLMNLRHLSQIMMSLSYEGDAGKAKSTLLFKKIITDFDTKISTPSSPKKWTLLSGHDTNVLPTLLFLNITSSSCLEQKWKGHNLDRFLNCEDGPDYASGLIFQLHQPSSPSHSLSSSLSSSSPLIKIKYNGKYINLCGQPQKSCPYSQWKSRVQYQYVNASKLCNNPSTINLRQQ